MARVTPAAGDRRPELSPADWATLSLLYAARGNLLRDADLPALAARDPALFERLSRLVALELVDYERRERAHYLNFDGFALVEGHEEARAETVVAIKRARAAQPAYQYTLGSLKWLLVGLIGIGGLVMLTAEETSGPPSRATAPSFTALDSATWVSIREELARRADSMRAQRLDALGAE